MQTRDEVKEKVLELNRDFTHALMKEIDGLLESSVINLSAHTNDFVLPKLLYVVALRRIAAMYAPMTPEYRETLREIEIWT